MVARAPTPEEQSGETGDEGIDAIIKEDKLGLDVIYIQAKRWKENNSISRPDTQQFTGALQGQQANKGIFITTSSFTKEALSFITKIGSKIVLIDGNQLAQLMIDHNVGVSVAASYEIKRIVGLFHRRLIVGTSARSKVEIYLVPRVSAYYGRVRRG
jgi:restriction system protein